jgi:nucleoside-diphosphate kinase
LDTRHNLVHASDSQDTAEREIELYFRADELCVYQMPDEGWLTAS